MRLKKPMQVGKRAPTLPTFPCLQTPGRAFTGHSGIEVVLLEMTNLLQRNSVALRTREPKSWTHTCHLHPSRACR